MSQGIYNRWNPEFVGLLEEPEIKELERDF
jgi:hypothetical protein